MASNYNPTFVRKIRTFFGSKPRISHLQKHSEHLKALISYTPSTPTRRPDRFYAQCLRMTWVIPDFKPGAGGHMTIFRMANYLEEFGHEVSILIQNPTEHRTGAKAKETINDHFQKFDGKVSVFEGILPDLSGDALIATDRYTCYAANKMNNFIRKFYFVQDFEPLFYPMGSEYLLAEATYKFDFDCLCAGDWLHKIVTERYGRWSMSWPLAYDPSIYFQDKSRSSRSQNRIAVYARHVTERRAVELIFLALEILYATGVDFEVDFFGLDLGCLEVDYPYRDHGLLDADDLASLYRECAIGVVFSATNHSLVNKEMMACGLPVVDLDLENVRTIFPKNTIAFADPTVEGISETIWRLLTQPDERERLSQTGVEYVKQFSWRESASLIEASIRERLSRALEGN
jgi:glycosyltransferase involved in cell wall biosynthesis